MHNYSDFSEALHAPPRRILRLISSFSTIVAPFLGFCLFCLSPLTSKAQQAASAQRVTAEQLNSWWCYFGTNRISDQWSLHSEAQIRRADFTENWMQLLLRAGLNFHASATTTLSGGYCFVEHYQYGEQPIAGQRSEHRLWEQVNLSHNDGEINYQHRFRLEQRWLGDFQTTAVTAFGAEYQNRMRYRFMTIIPLTERSKTNPWLFTNLYNEIFVNFAMPNPSHFNYFDQNRFGLTLGLQLNEQTNLQVGYMNHFVGKTDGRRFENNHTLTTFLTYNPDFRTP